MKFRTDINGLRTYAVLAVIIFHFKAQWLTGGFAGVDVFFVISGYLMTSIIFRGLEKNSFSLKKFYVARIKRIIPALLALVIFLMVFGLLFLSPDAYKDLAKHSAGSLLFISNTMYWQESGYFDVASIQKFLLHTWSLSVEWQFYILYPLVLIALSKILKLEILKKIVVILTILSLIISIYASPKWPTASYFLLHTRMWEMLLGGVAFLYPLELTQQRDKHFLELSGLALIIASFFMINENTIWPGYAALIPTLGAFILIQANNDKSIFTNNIVCQKLGLWSYSLYLWHWPLLVITHHFENKTKFWSFFLTTLLLSIASYYLIEKRKFKTSKVLILTLLGLIAATATYMTEGYKSRVEPNPYDESFIIKFQEYFNAQQQKTDTEYLMIGDSHAWHYLPYMAEKNMDIQIIPGLGCLFFSQPHLYAHKEQKQSCSDAIQNITNILKNNTKPIIWAQYWDLYETSLAQQIAAGSLNKDNFDLNIKYEDILYKTVTTVIESNPKVDIYLIGQAILPNYDVIRCVNKQQLSAYKWFRKPCNETQPKTTPKANQILKTIADQYPNVHFIDPNNAICNDSECFVIKNKRSLFQDDNHLSITAAMIIGQYIFEKIVSTNQALKLHRSNM